jgi:hypothetical protein
MIKVNNIYFNSLKEGSSGAKIDNRPIEQNIEPKIYSSSLIHENL